MVGHPFLVIALTIKEDVLPFYYLNLFTQNIVRHRHRVSSRGRQPHSRGNGTHSRSRQPDQRGYCHHSRSRQPHSRGNGTHSRSRQPHSRSHTAHSRSHTAHSRSHTAHSRCYSTIKVDTKEPHLSKKC